LGLFYLILFMSLIGLTFIPHGSPTSLFIFFLYISC